MPILIQQSFEPMSPLAKDLIRQQNAGDQADVASPLVLARSTALNTLQYQLLRYLKREQNGHSILICGHRGAGKTTLAWQAVFDLQFRNPEAGRRLLPISLFGPDLVAYYEDSGDDVQEMIHEKVHLEPGTQAKVRVRKRLRPPNGPGDSDKVLRDVVIGTHDALVREFSASLWALDESLFGRRPQWKHEFAAELSRQLEQSPHHQLPTPHRLREVWHNGGFANDGVLFHANGDASAGQGTRELLALSTSCEAYRRAVGSYGGHRHETARSSTTETTTEQKPADPGKSEMTRVWEWLTALASASVAGGAYLAAETELKGLITGVGTLIGTFIINRVIQRSRRKVDVDTESQALSYARDLTLGTLRYETRRLLRCIRDAGLYPVFIVDELDKSGYLFDRIRELAGDLKSFFGEEAVFCFVSDRSTYERIRLEIHGESYGKTHTYFRSLLFVTFRPDDLHEYLEQVLRVDPGPGDNPGELRADAEALRYVLLHRSRMHAIDLHRELSRIRGTEDRVTIPVGEVRTRREYMFDVYIQQAVQMELESPELKAWLERNPESRQIAYDALYYISREWLMSTM